MLNTASQTEEVTAVMKGMNCFLDKVFPVWLSFEDLQELLVMASRCCVDIASCVVEAVAKCSAKEPSEKCVFHLCEFFICSKLSKITAERMSSLHFFDWRMQSILCLRVYSTRFKLWPKIQNSVVFSNLFPNSFTGLRLLALPPCRYRRSNTSSCLSCAIVALSRANRD